MRTDEAHLSATITAATKAKLDRFADRRGIARDVVVEEALHDFLDSRDPSAAVVDSPDGDRSERRREVVAALRAELGALGTRVTALDPVEVVRTDRDR